MSVQSYLNDLSSRLVIKEEEKKKINTSLTTLSERIGTYFGPNVATHFTFGSYTRGTILPRKADQYSDIDYMIFFNNNAGYKPQTFLNQLRRFAEYYYSSSEISQSHPTMVLQLQHIIFELVPATKDCLGTLRIPSRSNLLQDWITTDPNGFNAQLTSKNLGNANLIKPLIRLVKRWNAMNGYPYSSFLMEKWISELFFLFDKNIKDYLVTVFMNLSYSWSTSQTTKDKVDRAKRIISTMVSYENAGRYSHAEEEIKKLIPDFS
jgi:sensor histidine kinase YesM